MKGFNIAPPQQSTQLPPVAEFGSSLPHQHSEPHSQHHYDMFGSTLSGLFGPGITPKKALHGQLHQFSSSQSSFGDTQASMSMLGKLAPKLHSKRIGSHKRKWGTLIEAAKSGSVSRFIGRSRSEDSVCNNAQLSRRPRNDGHRLESVSQSNSPVSEEAATESPTDSNPSLDRPDIESGGHHHHHEIQQKGKTSNHHHHFHFGALAALKRRRKKFSNSRHASPILEPTAVVEAERKLSNASRNMLQRAASVPTRVSLTADSLCVKVTHQPSSEHDQSHQNSVETQIMDHQSTLTSSTTEEECVNGGIGNSNGGGHHHISIPMYQEPILSGPIELLKPSTTPMQTPQITTTGPAMPNLPNVIPVRGHLHQQGWL